MKINNKILGIFFFVLLGLFIAKKTWFKPQQQSFRQELTSFDPASITKMTVNWGENPDITLSRKAENWEASDGSRTVVAREGSVDGLLEEMSGLKTRQLVSRNPDKWEEYEVNDAKAKNIKLYDGDSKIVDIHVGKFNFNQQTRSGLSYVRLDGDKETYSVDGFLSMAVARDFNSFRDNKLLNMEAASINSIRLEESGENVIDLSWTPGGTWVKNGVEMDSSRVSKYLNALVGVTGSNFMDEFDGSGADKIKTLLIGNEAIIDAFMSSDGTFVLKSDKNEAYFSSDSSGIFKTFFLDLEELD